MSDPDYEHMCWQRPMDSLYVSHHNMTLLIDLFNMSDPDYEHIVVGAGINGLWTAYHLASRGASVLLLEKV